VAGAVPRRLSELGDLLFERSRAQAQVEHDRMVESAQRNRTETDLLTTIYETRTGHAVPTLLLSEMPAKWEQMKIKRAPRYVKDVKSMHTQFIKFLGQKYPRVKTMAEVQTKMAVEFMATIAATNCAGATYNNKVDALRSTFSALAQDAGITKNPFAEIQDQEANTINRRPFPIEELERILGIARQPEHAFIYPALVVASMTAMREGDCCRLKKSAINRSEGTIRVKTAKTGKMATIPIAPKLAEILDQAPQTESEYVFPECARIYELNPTSITDRTRAVLHDAGYFDPVPGGPTPIGPITVERADGKGIRRVSVRDFHSFRATWVTIALTHGVPVEMVCLVTGHTSPETLRRHYFLPDHEDFRRVLKAKLPPTMGGAAESALDYKELLKSVIAKIELMTVDNWASIQTETIALLKGQQGAKTVSKN
jgi:integrase